MYVYVFFLKEKIGSSMFTGYLVLEKKKGKPMVRPFQTEFPMGTGLGRFVLFPFSRQR